VGDFQFARIVEYLPDLIRGVGITFQLGLISASLGLAIGLVLALMKYSGHPLLYWPGAVVFVGVLLASKVGLSSPFAEALANGGDTMAALRPQIIPGIIGGLIGGIPVILVGLAARQFLPTEMTQRIGEFGKFLPLATRLLYGGFAEELLLRWGVMTFLVWAAWRLFQKGKASPNAAVFIFAILISSVLFAIGHLPIAYLLFPDHTIPLTTFVIIGNSMFGLVAGYLYWKKGLESAMIAHAFTHLILFSASYFGAYF